MIKLFKHHFSASALLLAALEALLLTSILYATLFFYGVRAGGVGEGPAFAGPIAIIVAISFVTMASVGLYNRDIFLNARLFFARAAMSVGFVLATASVILLQSPELMLPGTERVLPALIVAILIYLLALVLVRMFCAGLVYPRAFRRRILVLGAGPIAAKVQGLLHTGAAHHLDIVGFVPLAQERARPHVSNVLAEHDFADHEGLAAFVEANDIDELVVATSERRGLPVYDLLGCKLDGRKVTDFLSFWEREAQCVDLDELQPSWLIFSDGFDISLTRLALKRAFDVVVSLVMLTATLPVTLLCALAIKLDSPGPIFYRQTRVGLDGVAFDVLKFRSMRTDAEKDGRPRWASQADDRITRVGRFVRQTRIDELPQIINVLKGEMSFVGPRPERPFFVAELAEKIPFYNERHRVKPGITGWAQINYPYGASEADAKAKLSYDLYYIKNGSLFLDLVILFQTVRVVLWPDGAR